MPVGRHAEGACRLDVRLLPRAEGLGPDDPGHRGPAGEGEHGDEREEPTPNDRDDRDGQRDDGERQLDVDEPAHDLVDPAPVEARRHAERDSDQGGDRHRAAADEEREARGMERPRHEVAAEEVGAEEMPVVARPEPGLLGLAEVDEDGIVGQPGARHACHSGDGQGDRQPQPARGIPPVGPNAEPQERRRGYRHGPEGWVTPRRGGEADERHGVTRSRYGDRGPRRASRRGSSPVRPPWRRPARRSARAGSRGRRSRSR